MTDLIFYPTMNSSNKRDLLSKAIYHYLSLAAGLVMNIPASVDNSLSWREGNTLDGMPGVGAMPITLSVSCPSALSVQQ